MTDVARLAEAQLDAYNRADLDAFCACYHPNVRVLDEEGAEVSRGIDAFRERYAALFARGGFGGRVETRLVLGSHCVDDEHWWRLDPETGERMEGRVLVRYRERDGLLAEAQFLR
ncbi:MAG: nuclear transport factor 2 family protein [Deltaproteobacteria bacterium]|nr:nuclear transport factor 2 family protein [Deltaproteobacteria bacterium]